MKNSSLYLVSACLVGGSTRYDGTARPIKSLISFLRNKSVLVVCPEIMGGLRVPRRPAQINCLSGKKTDSAVGEKVLAGQFSVRNQAGRDVTRHFLRGVQAVQSLVQSLPVQRAFLKSRSPACGSGSVYVRFPGRGGRQRTLIKLVRGNGVLAARLKKNKIKITSL
ncbi:MAG: DUF523 domain-containing protein [Planctomycetes bacterium]|nr:DUF523 domain-containing protein [Planctomycetota bacterium]